MDNFRKDAYPTLSNPVHWGVVEANFSFSSSFDEALVSNVSIIPYMQDKYVVFQIAGGMWELPGGTLEPGETYNAALKREVMEELGGELISYEVFGRFDCRSSAAKPYKPHIPHPKFTRIVGCGEINIVGKPLNPDDGEQVIAVEAVDIKEAIRRFEEINRHDIAELYKLAHWVRMNGLLEKSF